MLSSTPVSNGSADAGNGSEALEARRLSKAGVDETLQGIAIGCRVEQPSGCADEEMRREAKVADKSEERLAEKSVLEVVEEEEEEEKEEETEDAEKPAL